MSWIKHKGFFINRDRQRVASTQKVAYWVPGYHACIYHAQTGIFAIAPDEQTDHLMLSWDIANNVADGNVSQIYDEVYRGLYDPKTKVLAHSTSPDVFTQNRGISSPVNELAKNWDKHRSVWERGAAENNIPVSKVGWVDRNKNGFSVKFDDPYDFAKNPDLQTQVPYRKDFGEATYEEPYQEYGLRRGQLPWMQEF